MGCHRIGIALRKAKAKISQGIELIHLMKLFYLNTNTMVRINGTFLQIFQLNKDKCPTDPLLLALVVEPPSILIRNDPLITGFGASGRGENISLYADNILLYMGETSDILNDLY